MTSWKRHPQLGHVRDMNFTAPIKGAFGNWGVSHTACYQSQRCGGRGCGEGGTVARGSSGAGQGRTRGF
jgi:hypothetical protein